MDPPHDPHHPPQYSPFPPHFTNFPSHNPFFSPPQQPSPPPPPPQPSPPINHPPYSEMICTAISALNEQEGSSKQAISKYIERIYTQLPQAHNALLSHHLKSLKNNGVLMMVRKSYKFVPPTTSVAVASEVVPRSEFVVNENQYPLPGPGSGPVASVTPLTQKRGRGRPPKAKPDVVVGQSNGKPTWEQNVLPVVAQPPPQGQIQSPQTQPSVKRPPGRPRKDGTSPVPKAVVSGVSGVSGGVEINVSGGVEAVGSGGVEGVKRRGRPPSGRAVGRERKPTVVSAPVSVIPYVVNGGVRRRGRPKRVVDVGVAAAVPVVAANVESGGGGEEVGVVKRRGRGRPPKIGGVIRKPMKQMRRISRTGRPLGRPKKNLVASGQQDGGYVELKKKFELFVARAKDIVVVLKSETGGSQNQSLVRAIQSLEELTGETVEAPQHMEEEEEVHADEEHGETEPEPVGQYGHAQTEAEAMQQALF